MRAVDSFEEVQSEYIAEMEELRPFVEDWWNALFKGADKSSEASRHVWKRWPTGPAGHPRVLAVFRKYFLIIDRLNDINIIEYEKIEPEYDLKNIWKEKIEDRRITLFKPVDILINELEHSHPDIFEIVRGIAFIPVGVNHHKESV